jgi:hypothetical protein
VAVVFVVEFHFFYFGSQAFYFFTVIQFQFIDFSTVPFSNGFNDA